MRTCYHRNVVAQRRRAMVLFKFMFVVALMGGGTVAEGRTKTLVEEEAATVATTPTSSSSSSLQLRRGGTPPAKGTTRSATTVASDLDVELELDAVPLTVSTTTATSASRTIISASSPCQPYCAHAQELYYDHQRINHFGPVLTDEEGRPGAASTYRQRYILSDEYYSSAAAPNKQDRPLFFYFGNEADVMLYVNQTGLIWEHAAHFNALVVFGEHRYYGHSQPFPPSTSTSSTQNDTSPVPLQQWQYLSSEQALLDYVTLLASIKEAYNVTGAVIGFGGSYGGMLATWGRMKYPHVWDGVIAASAPILPFETADDDDDELEWDTNAITTTQTGTKQQRRRRWYRPNFFAEGVTYDVTPAAGSAAHCEQNLRHVFAEKALITNRTTAREAATLRAAFHVCPDDPTPDPDVGWKVTQWLNTALAYMAMGNFPYASSYILQGAGVLPAFPVRVACDFLAHDWTTTTRLDDDAEESEKKDYQWLQGLASFAGVYYNYSRTLACNELAAPVNNASKVVNRLWDYQYCSQLFMVGGQGPDDDDMFWDEPWNGTATAQRCSDQYGVYPDRYHIALEYGTPDDWQEDEAISNIVWSQGEYDPWKGGGMTRNISDSLISIVIPEAAHHLDLFFSHVNDTRAVREARNFELSMITKWIHEKNDKTARTNMVRQPMMEVQKAMVEIIPTTAT